MRILIHGRHFPVAMFRFFHWALEEMGHQVYSVGPYSRGHIPWGDYYFPEHKYPPALETPDATIDISEVLLMFRKHFTGKPDLILQAGDNIYLSGKTNVPNFILATDPHVIDYTVNLLNADKYFYMQNYCKPNKAVWVPYAYDPNIHFPVKREEKYDVVLCGLQYEHRLKAVEMMRKRGMRVFNALGLIYEAYNEAYGHGKIAFNLSSKEDLPARFWEGLAMGKLMITNRVPDLKNLDLKEDVDYVAYSSPEEMIEKLEFYLSHDSARDKIATSGLTAVRPHTYQERCMRILNEFKI